MKIPLVDLSGISSKSYKVFRKNIVSGSFILGSDVNVFEKNFAKYIGTKYCIGVGSGADALLLSLKALGVGEGDEVIVPTMTFMATASSVIHAGATPVFVDILPTIPLINPAEIKKKITKKTKAIIPVHLHGYPCNMEEIKKIAREHKLFLLEDACQAHGSIYKNKHAGNLGDIAAFSFYPSKNLGAFGDGGAITTSNKSLAEKLYNLRNQGTSGKYMHTIVGYNSRLDTVHAAILNYKLTFLDQDNTLRRKHAKLYNKLLKNLPLALPAEYKDGETNYHVYAIQTKKRDQLLTYLTEKGIQCVVHYPIPLHLQPALSFLKYKKGNFPNAEIFADETLSLPMYPALTVKQIEYICKYIVMFFELDKHV